MGDKILITGKSGFLGKIVYDILSPANTIYSLGRATDDDIKADLINGDISITHSIDIVIHIAGKAHSIPGTAQQQKEFYDVNVTGTSNLLAALEAKNSLPKAFVFISSVAVYGIETGINIKEDAPLLANDPYGKSKILAERLITNWCEEKKVICTILRLPLVAGQNPPGNLRSMITGISKGYYFNISGGHAKKSIVMAKDVALIIPIASKKGGIYNLTDNRHPSFLELSQTIANQLQNKKPKSLPNWFATLIAKLGDMIGSKAPINSSKLSKITSSLTFDSSKASLEIGWDPKSVVSEFQIH